MWRYEYRDYVTDDEMKRETLESGRGITGCEMHDVNGWNERHLATPEARGGLSRLFDVLFGWRKRGGK